jgi:hypothetical protein
MPKNGRKLWNHVPLGEYIEAKSGWNRRIGVRMEADFLWAIFRFKRIFPFIRGAEFSISIYSVWIFSAQKLDDEPQNRVFTVQML